jgi:hypothetical protein
LRLGAAQHARYTGALLSPARLRLMLCVQSMLLLTVAREGS